MSRHAAIVATGSYLPEIDVSNEELRERFAGTHPGAIDLYESDTGIRTRRYAPEGWSTSDLAVRAGLQALERAGLSPLDLDLVIVGTDTPDFLTPATSVVVQHKLGAQRAGTFDVACSCASFTTALSTGAALLAGNPGIGNVLVIGAYMMRRLASPDDPTIFFYGDGAGAVLLQASEVPGVRGTAFCADGSYAKHWGILSGGTAEPATEASVRERRTCVRVYRGYPPAVNRDGWPALVQQLCSSSGFAPGDIDLTIFTQVSRKTILGVMESLGLPLERTHLSMEKWGYTGSACIPMALHDAIEQRRVGPGSLLVLLGSGVGYNHAAVAVNLTDSLRC
jgi:3-oxoacyl-[acyl-carrier-protein] synthase-3